MSTPVLFPPPPVQADPGHRIAHFDRLRLRHRKIIGAEIPFGIQIPEKIDPVLLEKIYEFSARGAKSGEDFARAFANLAAEE